jgi:DNA-binding LacI/PurR family transcriptional regulator
MTQLLALDEPPTAVFSMSDEMAYGAMRALTLAGIPVGGNPDRGEIAMIGFDGHDLADAFDLSTVAQPVRDLGRAAADLLMARVVGTVPARDVEACVLPTVLHARGSTAVEKPVLSTP